ncbi:MAG: hypothetical protein JWO38_7614 [Gemmataceae bacterium]|nr:hypothetical protein [Gemmataceae bacterium]
MPTSSPAHPLVGRPVPGQRTFYRLGAILLVVGVLFWAKAVFIPLALAILLTFALSPVAGWLERHGLGRVPSCLLVSGAALGLVAGLGWVAGTQIRELARDVEEKNYTENMRRKFQPVLALLDRVDHLGTAGADVPGPIVPPGGQPADPNAPPGQLTDGARAPVPVVVIKPKTTEALAWVPSLAGPVVEGLAASLLVTVLTIFMLIQRESVRDRLLALAGRRQLTTTTRALDDAARRVSRYLLLQASTNAAMGLILGVGLYLIGIPYPALWGLLTAALRFIPYIGIWLSALFPIALAVAVFPGWTQVLVVLALYAGSDLLMTNVIEPLLFGRGTGVSSLALLIAATFWAFLWGPVGLLLAVPLTVCLVVLGEHIPSLKFLHTLLGDEASVDPTARYFHRVLSGQSDEAALLVGEQAAARPLPEVYDGVILPAVAQAKAERDRGDITPDEERTFYRVTRGLMGGVLAGPRAEAAEKPGGPTARVVACSVRGEADRIALAMFRDLVPAIGGEIEIVPASQFVDMVRDRAGRGEKVVACVGTVSPGGLAQAGGLCRQIRARCPGVGVVVGRWGMSEDKAGTEQFLTAAGASRVTWTLRETLAALAPDAAPAVRTAAPDRAAAPAEPGQVTVPA